MFHSGGVPWGEPSPVADVLAASLQALQAGDVSTMEDVPIFLALWPKVLVDGDGRVRLVSYQEFGHGMLWAVSSTWDGRTPHLHISESALHRRIPDNGLLVRLSPVFDFLYSPASLMDVCSTDRNFKRGVREGVTVAVDVVQPARMQSIVVRSLGESSYGFPAYYPQRFRSLLDCAPMLAEQQTAVLVLRDKWGEDVGFSWIWVDGGVMYVPYTHILGGFRQYTRLLLWHTASLAASMGLQAINYGDANGLPGLTHFKFSLRPSGFCHYYDVWPKEVTL